MPEKLIIENRTGRPILEILSHVEQVLVMGRISKNDTQYCYATKFDDDIIVYASKNKQSDKFVVSNYKKIG